MENAWDFTDPNAMPGFGPITPEEVARLLTQGVTLTEPPPAPQPAQVAAIEDKSAGEIAPPAERCGGVTGARSIGAGKRDLPQRNMATTMMLRRKKNPMCETCPPPRNVKRRRVK